MKARENPVRLKQFRERQAPAAAVARHDDRRVRAHGQRAGTQIAAEEKKAGITDINHFAYPTFAKAARLRRDNLMNSQQDLLQQRTTAESLLAEAEAELSKAEALESRDARSRDAEVPLRSAMIG